MRSLPSSSAWPADWAAPSLPGRPGVLAGRLWGGQVDTTINSSVAFSLRSLSVLLLWPAATATCVFVLSLLNLLKKGPDGGRAPLAEGTAPGA